MDYYTVDDGATYFEDLAFPQRVPPFQKDGKTAYRAIVWSCEDGKNPKVTAIQKFSDAAKAKLQALVDAKNLTDPLIGEVAETWIGTQVKPPKTGDTGWMSGDDPKAAPLLFPNCPGGATPTRLMPE